MTEGLCLKFSDFEDKIKTLLSWGIHINGIGFFCVCLAGVGPPHLPRQSQLHLLRQALTGRGGHIEHVGGALEACDVVLSPRLGTVNTTALHTP